MISRDIHKADKISQFLIETWILVMLLKNWAISRNNHLRCSREKTVIKNLAILQENTCHGVCFQ